MKIIITESQYKTLTENFDSVLDIYSKKNKGETLKPSELDVLKVFNNYVNEWKLTENLQVGDSLYSYSNNTRRKRNRNYIKYAAFVNGCGNGKLRRWHRKFYL